MGRSREFSFKEKQEIISHHESLLASRQNMSNKALTEWANVKYGTSVSQMTIGRLLKRKGELTTFDVGHLAHTECIRKVQCPKVKQATFNWVITMQERSATISDDLVIATAKRFYALVPRDPSEKELQF